MWTSRKVRPLEGEKQVEKVVDKAEEGGAIGGRRMAKKVWRSTKIRRLRGIEASGQ
jgi:hypothetical protein